ncbi:predicted protein [Naegleria gruberi]|uniref:Predicted protein n=1 Tax=Naegleria gruberi TaxID=5762 RepID=D2VY22_NAEGR|nr:uncharacterized protein NAEGRDRAFT_73944 [Naegleria gruberi]EFC38289.1 predicted protein [Naegleria gruberi]|eukprot:XP_002671033.1 predicted protein [Naegleria gruberi strain NEG-M]
MQLPSIASLLNDSPEKVILPSVKELEQLKVNTDVSNNQNTVQNSTVVGFKSYNNNNNTSLNNNTHHHLLSNSQQHSNNQQVTSYTCTSSTTLPSSNNNHNISTSPLIEEQRFNHSSTFLQQQHAYINGMWKSTDIASDNYSNTRKWDESNLKIQPNSPNTITQPIPIFQNKWSTTTSNLSATSPATFKPIISPNRTSPLSFTPSVATTASNSSNASENNGKKKRKHDESSESSSPITNSPKLVKRNSGTSRKSPNSTSSSASSFQFMNFSISSDSSKIKFVNSEHQQIGINDGSWTDQEHEDFVRGLNECGKGRWREIAEKYVKTR